MAGLLGLDDDMRLALMTAGLGTLAGRGGPMRAAGQGGLLGVASYQQSKRDKADAERERLRDDLLRAQLEEYKRKQSEAERMRQGYSAAVGGAMIPGSPGRPAGLGDVDAGMDVGMQPAVPPRAPGFDYGRFAELIRDVDPAAAVEAIGKAQPKQKELKETRTLMRNGQRVTVNFYKDGTHEILPYSPDAEKAHFANTGGEILPLDPFTGRPVGQGVKTTVDPNTAYTGNITMRGQNMTDARAREANTATQAGNVTKSVAELRKEFNGLDEVKNFKAVVPMVRSAMSAPDTPAGDLDVIYAVGKVLDPGSVVREGELNLVIKSGTPLEQYQGYVRAIAQGKGRLPPAQRKKLVAMLQGRTNELEDSYRRTRAQYEKTAAAAGLPMEQIFADTEASGGASGGWSAVEVK